MSRRLRNSVSEVYKKSNTNKNNYVVDKSIEKSRDNSNSSKELKSLNVSNVSNNILNRNQFTNKNPKPSQGSNESQFLTPNQSLGSNSGFLLNPITLLILLILVFLFTVIVFFKQRLYNFFKSVFLIDDSEIEQSSKENEVKHQNITERDKSDLRDQSPIDTSTDQKNEEVENKKNVENDINESKANTSLNIKGKKQENDKKINTAKKSNTKPLYSQDQHVKNDGFCYIGTDDNTRQCIEVYNGDICTSGDVYKRIDTCLLPTHFQ